MRRIISVNVLAGEPTDGSGRVCTHLFVQDEAGPLVEPHVLHAEDVAAKPGQPAGRQIVAKPTRGRLACDPKRTVAPVKRGNVTTITPRTSDPRAATCRKCIASKDYADMMAFITEAEAAR